MLTKRLDRLPTKRMDRLLTKRLSRLLTRTTLTRKTSGGSYI